VCVARLECSWLVLCSLATKGQVPAARRRWIIMHFDVCVWDICWSVVGGRNGSKSGRFNMEMVGFSDILDDISLTTGFK